MKHWFGYTVSNENHEFVNALKVYVRAHGFRYEVSGEGDCTHFEIECDAKQYGYLESFLCDMVEDMDTIGKLVWRDLHDDAGTDGYVVEVINGKSMHYVTLSEAMNVYRNLWRCHRPVVMLDAWTGEVLLVMEEV